MTDPHRYDPDKDRLPVTAPGWRRYLPWIIGAAAIILLLLLLSRCGGDDATVSRTTDATAVPAETSAAVPASGATAAPSGLSGLDAFLASSEAAPRTFVFERVNFDSGSSNLRDQDRDEIRNVATVLTRYPNARVRLIGYADASGSGAANAALAQARADIVRSALTAVGVDARRIEAVSGGETNPVSTNATAGGMAQNRRTELVVTQR